MLATVLERVRRVWRDKVAGPTLRTYDAACDELGGEPWRPLPEATDRWFLADRPKSLVGRLPSAAQLPTLDTGSFDLRRRLSDRTKLALLAGAALLAIVVVVLALAHGSPVTTRAPIVTPPAAIVTAPPPTRAPTATAVISPAAPASVVAALPATAKPARTFVAAKRHFAHRRRR